MYVELMEMILCDMFVVNMYIFFSFGGRFIIFELWLQKHQRCNEWQPGMLEDSWRSSSNQIPKKGRKNEYICCGSKV